MQAAPPPAHTDLRMPGWIARLPSRWRPYAVLGRFDRPIGIWLLFWPGAWAILLARLPPWPSLRLLTLFALGSAVMRAAGCVVNDMWDRDIDRQVDRTRTRPLAAGTLGLRQAALFLAVLLAIGLLILLQLDPRCWSWAIGALVLVALYPLAKRVTAWPQIVLGCTFGYGAPLGLIAATGRIGGAGLALYGAAIVWILGYDTIYAHQDRRDDAMLGLGSTALALGGHTRSFLAGCYGLCLLLLGIAGWRAGLSSMPFLGLLILPAGLLGWQVLRLRIDDAGNCLRLFRHNREVGWAVALAILAGRIAT